MEFVEKGDGTAFYRYENSADNPDSFDWKQREVSTFLVPPPGGNQKAPPETWREYEQQTFREFYIKYHDRIESLEIECEQLRRQLRRYGLARKFMERIFKDKTQHDPA